MAVYWAMFLVPVYAALVPLSARPNLRKLLWVALGLLFVMLIGFRYEVGGDWGPYSNTYENMNGIRLLASMGLSDPAYGILNWISYRLGGGIYLVNLVCGSISIAGIFQFASRQPRPWLALAIAVPYLIVVVAMGYTRQSAAIGFEFLAITALLDGRFRSFISFVIFGALFHKSAIVLLPLGLLASSKSLGKKNILLISISFIFLAIVISLEVLESLWVNYVEADVNSSGGPVRVAMNALPAFLMIVLSRRISPEENERRLWFWIAVLSITCIPLVLVASTAVDRVALYFMPIQLYVFSRFPSIFEEKITRTIIILGIFVYYASVQFVWLNFATYASYHVPYAFYPLEAL